MRLIEEWLPEFDVRERHDAAVAAPPDRALDLALAAPVAPDRVVGALLAARGMPARGRTIEDFLRALEFDHVGRTPTEWAASRDRPRLKIAISFESEPIPGGARLSTETRVKALEGRSLRAFRLYWLGVGPFSGLIRRRWLRAVQAAART